MYASISPWRAQKDPTPFVVLETGERTTAASMGQLGVTLQFEPRAEFMPNQINAVNQILDEFREFFTEVDPWGSSMAWLGLVAGVLKKNFDEHAPAHWRGELQLGEAGPISSVLDELSPAELHKQLLHAGEVMNRLANQAWLENKDYPLSRGS